jgi:hypothetical protein
MTNEATIRVAHVEDCREIREGLALIINAAPGFVCKRSGPQVWVSN